MTTEFILLLGLYVTILLGVFLGDRGPHKTFNKSGPRLAANIERDIAVGKNFLDRRNPGASIIEWQDPGSEVQK